MTLLETLSKDRIAAFKAGEKAKATLLATVIAEAKTDARKVENRDPTDAEMQTKIRKFIKNADDALAAMPKDAPQRDGLETEKDILGAYLPAMLDEAATRAAVEAIVADLDDASPKAMGRIMAELKARHGNTVDMKLASALTKQALG